MDTLAARLTYPQIQEVAPAPDGRHVAFVLRQPLLNDDHSEFVSHLLVAGVGSSLRRFTWGAHRHRAPQWSPDGTRIAFLSDRHGRSNLYVIDANGGEAVAVTRYEHAGVRAARWSHDGRWLAFLITEPPSPEREAAQRRKDDAFVWGAELLGAHLFVVSAPALDALGEPTPGPLAPAQEVTAHIAPALKAELKLAEPAPAPPQRVTAGAYTVLDFDWFPDGRRLAFTYRPMPEWEHWTETRLAIAALPAPGATAAAGRSELPAAGSGSGSDSPPETPAPAFHAAIEEVALVGSWTARPLISPDGQWIACATADRPGRWAISSRVWLYPAEPASGAQARPLAETPDAKCEPVGWSADGQAVVVLEQEGVTSQFWALPADGGPARRLTDTPLYKTAPARGDGGQIAFVGQDLALPNGIYLLDPARREVTLIYQPPWPPAAPEEAALPQAQDPSTATGASRAARAAPDKAARPQALAAPRGAAGSPPPARRDAAALPRTEVVCWPAAGGASIEGILIYPLEYRPGDRFPLVVDLHGGPPMAHSRTYLGALSRAADALLLAARGFAVLRPNPRGSSGYGRDFRFANYGEWGDLDYADVMAGVEALIERGLADPQRLCIAGWSYGGYLAAMAIAQTGRFRAACVGAGLTDLISYNGTSDVPDFVPDYLGAEFWDDLERYRRHSPLFQARAIRTPTLILHGERDERVPVGQGRELYHALRRLGVPVDLVIYPREGHSIEEPRHLLDRARRVADWFTRWCATA